MTMKSYFVRLLLCFTVIVTVFNQTMHAAENLELYTPFTKVSVAPGESITFSLKAINHSQETQTANINVIGVPRNWDYSLKSGALNVKQLAVLPDEKQTVTLKLEVPLNVNKGNYPITVLAGGSKLPLVVNISKQGSNKTEFTSDQANMQGHSKSDFTFKAKLKNRTGDKQLYALQSKTPRGWRVVFKPNYKQATAVEVEANNAKDVSIEIKAPQSVKAGTYKIPVAAVNNQSSAELELEVVITGTYTLELTTPRGLLSTNITAGSSKVTESLIRNTGSSTLNNIKLSSSKPAGWEINFKPAEIPTIEPGKQTIVEATVKADKKAVAGDYVCNISAKVPEVSSQIALRISVKTPLFWGWMGILIIFIALGSLVYLFRKYGRR